MKNIKHILILALFIFFVKINIFAQLSFPDYTTNPSWRMKDFANPTPSSIGVYRLGTETIMGGKIFLKIYYKNQTWTKDSLVGFITDGETGHSKFYIKHKATTFIPNPKLHLLYDFSLQVGDTTYCAPCNFYSDSDSFKFWVERIDYPIYEGKQRKRLLMNFLTPDGGDGGSMYWVEGIGALHDPFYLFGCYTGGCESFKSLICFQNEGKLQYGHPLQCNTTPTGDLDINDTNLKVFPTITTHEIQIENNTDKQLKVIIVNSLGQIIKTETMLEKLKAIDVSALPKGIYFIQFWDKKLLKSVKFVKV